MTIFNWVHHKFSHNSNSNSNSSSTSISPKKDELASAYMGKLKTVTNMTEKKPLLDQVNFVNVWENGILLIGTFGYDNQDDYSPKKQEQEEYFPVTKGLELQPIVDVKQELEETKLTNITVVNNEAPEISLLQFVGLANMNMMTCEVEIEKKRTTLADLFNDRVDTMQKSDLVADIQVEYNKKKPVEFVKGRPSFGKKHTDKGEGGYSRPIRKVQRIMSKMLKKKIHPDIEGRVHRGDGLEEQSNNTPARETSLKHGGRLESFIFFKAPRVDGVV